ncbi:MAG TPA: hypothetical protein VHO47_02620 [Candidatus Babeliales bacterium]|nr:hypothetical protein [Candidatus Babeliales bacterium]
MIKPKIMTILCISTFTFNVVCQDPQSFFKSCRKAIYGWISGFKPRRSMPHAHTANDPRVMKIFNGPFKNEEFFFEQPLPNSAVNLFDLNDQFPVGSYVQVISEQDLKPHLVEEFNKYQRGEFLGNNAFYKSEPLFKGRIFYGTLLSNKRSVCIHESWLEQPVGVK